ncbi:hypothetical protein AM629_15340 [Photorhabdus heterorhabditis]|uniref:Secreted protein n=1 Tax=Photorhabdus heterorhabditis TaxID=880156 RepID=A0ABR5K995_9GAMM|nr:hypothetical protein AM629_15340 [Photorhabdus heterorhabditis]
MLLKEFFILNVGVLLITFSGYKTQTELHLYPIDFKMHRDGKGANPREHRELCDWGECCQQRGNLKDNRYIWDEWKFLFFVALQET